MIKYARMGLINHAYFHTYSKWVETTNKKIIHDPHDPRRPLDLQVTQFCLRQIMRNRFEFVALEQQRLARASWKTMGGMIGIYDGYV